MACSGQSFEFRGYTTKAGCGDIVAAESKYGTVSRVSREEVPKLGKAEITELSVKLFGRSATAKVACFAGGIVDVYYTVPGSTESGAQSSFEWLSGELRKEFGPWIEESGTTGRIRTFVCGVPATVRLAEDTTGSTSQATLVVVPRPSVC